MIDVNAILTKNFISQNSDKLNEAATNTIGTSTGERIKAAIKEIVEEVLKEAAEKVKMNQESKDSPMSIWALEDNNILVSEGNCHSDTTISVDKQSIMDIAKQVKYE